MAGLGSVSGDDAASLMGSAREAISNIGTAVSLRETLAGLGAAGKTNSADSSMLAGIGQLVGGVGTAFKGLTETQQALFGSLLSKQSGGGGGDQNQLLMFLLLMQMMDKSNERTESAMARVLETRDKAWEERYRDLEGRSGPSQADTMTHNLTTQLLAESISSIRKPPPDPVDVLLNARERLQKLGGNVGGLLGGSSDTQYTEGYLRHRELENDLQKTIAQYSWQGAQRQATTELTKAIMEGGPQLVQSLVVGTLQTLAAMGLLPGVQGLPAGGAAPAPQQDSAESVAAADAALARAGAK